MNYKGLVTPSFWWSWISFFLLCLCCFPRLCYAFGMFKIWYNGGKN